MTGSDLVPFQRFMDEALYGASGFYRTGGAAGRRGDFLTSPEVGPLFGAVVARFLDAEWRRLGEPDEFTVVDAGAGPGTLARTVLTSEPDCAASLRYVAVEVSAAQRDRHPAGIESVADLPDELFDGVIIANELLDNLPFRLVVFDDGWREAFVERDADGRCIEHLGAVLDPCPDWLPASAPLGARAPMQEEAHRWIETARSRVRRGSVVAIDYVAAATASLTLRPWREWLRTYRGHERGGHYLATPGEQDITTEVCLDQLPEPSAVRSQAQWLQLHGIDALVEEGRVAWAELDGPPDLAVLRLRSRISESEALLDPTGLGGFAVVEWRAQAT